MMRKTPSPSVVIMANTKCPQKSFSFSMGHTNPENETRYKVLMIVVSTKVLGFKPKAPPRNSQSSLSTPIILLAHMHS
jgi:hypothetical protein